MLSAEDESVDIEMVQVVVIDLFIAGSYSLWLCFTWAKQNPFVGLKWVIFLSTEQGHWWAKSIKIQQISQSKVVDGCARNY